jgi:hypothetical protein
MASDSRGKLNPWQNVPRISFFIFMVAVFFTFSTMGFVNDVSDMARLPTTRFVLGVLISGVFATIYAYAGIRLRNKFWLAFIPVFPLHIFLMGWIGHTWPDLVYSIPITSADESHIQQRLNFDSIAISVAVVLAYTGFVIVFVSEFRRHVKVHAEKAKLENEMEAAREVQSVIVPEESGKFPGFRVDAVYTPAQQVGGDFYQILSDGAGGMFAVIGDVSGKGLPAAMMVSMLVGSIRTAAEQTTDPAQILRTLHDRLIGRTAGGFSTAIAAHIARNGVVSIANAGHLPPYLDGKEIELAGSLPLGIDGGGEFQETSLSLRPSSRLVFCTDGVVEAQGATGELFGFDRTRQISTRPATEIAEAAVQFGQVDDITVVVIEWLAQWN